MPPSAAWSAGWGSGVLAGVAKKTAGLFFSAMDDVLTGKRAVSAVAAGAVADTSLAAPGRAPGQPGARPGPGFGAGHLGRGPRRGPPALLGAAAFGALSMLVGVLVGAKIARRGE